MSIIQSANTHLVEMWNQMKRDKEKAFADVEGSFRKGSKRTKA
jgi:hypothetical protein